MSTYNCPKCPEDTLCASDNDRLREYSALPILSVSYTDNACHLTNLDADLNMPSGSNFSYYTVHDFHSNPDISESFTSNSAFSILNFNVRSLSANIDHLSSMLSELYFPFSVIGLTETKIKVGQTPGKNIDFPGYHKFVSQPTLSDFGGVGFYVKDNLDYHKVKELSETTVDYEALWIDIQNTYSPNILCGIIYRHPSGNLDNFLKYLNTVLESVDHSNKHCAILGDINLDLLKIESHQLTDTYLDTMSSYFFQPHILQPTRISEHSATLIDHIFFNSLEHFTISGNIIYDISDHLPNFLIFDKFSAATKHQVA